MGLPTGALPSLLWILLLQRHACGPVISPYLLGLPHFAHGEEVSLRQCKLKYCFKEELVFILPTAWYRNGGSLCLTCPVRKFAFTRVMSDFGQMYWILIKNLDN